MLVQSLCFSQGTFNPDYSQVNTQPKLDMSGQEFTLLLSTTVYSFVITSK